MGTARIAEAILRDEQAVIPIGSFNPKYGVTLAVASVLSRHGLSQIFEPEMSEEERQGLQRSADILRNAVARTTQGLPWVERQIRRQDAIRSFYE